MGKYEILSQFLREQATQEVPVTFAEIEHVIGGKLPRSAYVHRPWWSNNPSNSAMTRERNVLMMFSTRAVRSAFTPSR